MKKLAVTVVLVALSSISAAAAAGEGTNWILNGTYAMSATGSCLHATGGFSGVVPSGTTWGAFTMTEGTWLFRPDGTGHASLTNHIVTPPGAPASIAPIDTRAVSFDFSYAVNPQGVLALSVPVFVAPGVPGALQLVGDISIDKKTLVLNNSNQAQYVPYATSYAICNITRVLTRVLDD